MEILMDVLLMLGGVAVFMYGMKLMSSGLEQSAGSKIRNLFKKLDRNRVVNYGIGIGSTAVVQSSSATSIMTVGLAHADIVTVKQGAGYILGAKVGTTLTAFLFALSGTREENVFGPEAQHMRAPLREAAKDRQIIMDRRAKSLPPPKKNTKNCPKTPMSKTPKPRPEAKPTVGVVTGGFHMQRTLDPINAHPESKHFNRQSYPAYGPNTQKGVWQDNVTGFSVVMSEYKKLENHNIQLV